MPTAPITRRPWPRLNVHQQRRVARLRWMGKWALGASIVIAVVVYRVASAYYEPTMQDLLPETARAIERQRGILFGRGVATLIGWLEFFQRPAGHATLVVILGLIAAAVCYQSAHRIEVDEG